MSAEAKTAAVRVEAVLCQGRAVAAVRGLQDVRMVVCGALLCALCA